MLSSGSEARREAMSSGVRLVDGSDACEGPDGAGVGVSISMLKVWLGWLEGPA
jgi:hypothetical protein